MADDDFHKQPTIHSDVSGPSKEPVPPPLPAFIGPYKIDALLEKGGMNLIYLGFHPETNEPTTIKVLLPKFKSHPDIVKRFLTEAEIIAMADHPNIVKLYGHGEWEGGLYIAMEFIQGTSLRQLLLQNPLSIKRALEIVIDIAYALCHLHTHGVIHRDLKPENILVTEQDIIKVIDFGIAQLLTEGPGGRSHPKQRTIGTPIYMSPEQQEDPESVSYPSDVYSLGIISYELVLGKLSHGHIHLSLMPKGLQKILAKALQPNPKERYQDVVDFITDITAYLKSEDFEKERKVGDRISELSEDLRTAKGIMTPHKPTDWTAVEIGLTTHQGLSVLGIYYDFIPLVNGFYGVILTECHASGAESVIFIAMIRGIIQTLINQTTNPVELATRLNKVILDQHIEQKFSFNFLLFNPLEDNFRYLCCGSGNLWQLTDPIHKPVISNNPTLGKPITNPYEAATGEWKSNETLLLTSFSTVRPSEPSQTFIPLPFFEGALTPYLDAPPQKLTEGLMLKIKTFIPKNKPDQGFTLIALKKLSH